MNHTEEPWEFFIEQGVVEVIDTKGKAIIHWMSFDACEQSKKEKMRNLKRIVACVNACVGMDDPDFWVKKLLKSHDYFRDQRNRLLERIKYIGNIDHRLDLDDMHREIDILIAKVEGTK